MKRTAAIAGAAILLLALQTPLRAMAAYCGPSADTMAVESLTVSRGAQETRIMSILVVENYARVDVESKGRLTEYYVKDCGRWRFSGNTPPADAPASVKQQLSEFVTRDDGGKECLNPAYVNHSSAP